LATEATTPTGLKLLAVGSMHIFLGAMLCGYKNAGSTMPGDPYQ
jgi:hypothetical protein